MWLKVTRVGNTWTYKTSDDGVTWTEQLSFDLALTVAQVGVYGANPSSGTPAPSNHVIVDYFFNGAAPITPEDGGDTVFDIWYGDSQKFGNKGDAQKYIDVLGNVDDSDGLSSLSFKLNGGASQNLNVGPDGRRLLMPGDFDAQIPTSDLVSGANTVAIKAIDSLANETTKTVTVTWTPGTTWPLPYSINWSSVTNIQDVAQVVDGQWKVTPGGLLTVDVGYDRLIDIGDVTWNSYQVEVPITIRGLDTVNGYDAPSYGPALGILMGWDGHEDCSAFLETICDPSAQPIWGWWPSGDLGELRWTTGFEGIRLIGFNPDTQVEQAQSIEIGATYHFKMKVEVNGSGPLYSLKIWKDGTTEPASWLTDQQGEGGDPVAGSFLLLVHHVDVAIGNVTVTALP
jgi:hypothetical protein